MGRGYRARRRRTLGVLVVGLLAAALPAFDAAAQAPVDAMRARANAGTVGVVSGGVDGTYVRIAADLAAVLDSGDTLRVLPMIGKGSVQNISDVIFLRGIDIGIVQSDVLTYAKRERLFPGVDKSIQYIAKLYDEELHILAGRDVSKVEDLAGKKVNVDLRGSGTAMTASLVFDRLGVAVEQTNDDQALALEKLKNGQIAALAYVTGRPARLFRDVNSADGLHFLAVPMNPALLETYLPSQLTHEDYPMVVPNGAAVETVAVGAVMAVYNWTPESERYRKVARFVDAFFSKFDAFLQPPRHPKWREVNLAAQVPGWTRFAEAENWLRRETAALAGSSSNATRDSPLRQNFDRFVALSGGSGAMRDDAQREALFEAFLRWQTQQRQRQ
jgi:TRAP transporter TAXI family solute receptor